jgi:hypothetical protein
MGFAVSPVATIRKETCLWVKLLRDFVLEYLTNTLHCNIENISLANQNLAKCYQNTKKWKAISLGKKGQLSLRPVWATTLPKNKIKISKTWGYKKHLTTMCEALSLPPTLSQIHIHKHTHTLISNFYLWIKKSIKC